VILAARGYPGTPVKHAPIGPLAAAEAEALVFQSGTERRDGALVSSGGRVLAVTGTGADLVEAHAAAYRAVNSIQAPDLFHRRDIGWRAVGRG
jgi:phosphoribosylamine--glycine ligase